ncbi:MAG: hypothetical protein KUG76_08235 [Gammaproteobacteria bacterium]|nr:hypothetical protein [Gammaproteobacteria bacterium]
MLGYEKKPIFITAVVFGLFIFVYLLICRPVLYGTFVLDDWPNLNNLDKINGWEGIFGYSLSGTSSAVGRPISYFSFALQYRDWPGNPFPFKLVNLIIHVVNGFLYYLCCYLIACELNFNKSKTLVFASISAAFWIFLPLHASTVFYVIQRMVLLAAFFTLLGVFGFLFGTFLENRQRSKLGRWVATLGMLAAYSLGILSKENAILVGVFVGILYFQIVRRNISESKKWWDCWVLCVAVLPVLMVAVYLLWGGRYLNGYAIREFTLEQRIYSQWAILWNYIEITLLPSSMKINLFNDDFVVPSGLFDRVTLLSGFAWLFTIALAYLYRKKYPFLLFGMLWFLGGHLLESTVIALELVFEHRNYLPSAGLVIALVWAGFYFWERLTRIKATSIKMILKIALAGVVIIYFLWMLMVLSKEAVSWKDHETFVMTAVYDRPGSLRAHQEAVGYLAKGGEYTDAAILLKTISRRWPDNTGTYAWMLFFQCIAPNVIIPPPEKILGRFKQGGYDLGAAKALYEIYKLKKQQGCQEVSWPMFRAWVFALMSNPNWPPDGANDNLFRLEIFSYIEENNLSRANKVFSLRNENEMSISLLRLKVELLYAEGKNIETLYLVNRVKDRFKNDKKLWAINGQFFIDVEKGINAKPENIHNDKK